MVKSQKDRFLFYPFLFVFVPLLYIYSDTYPQFQIEQTYRIIGFYLLFALIILFFLWFFLHSWQRAGLVSSWFFMFYFSYGSAYQWMSIHFPDSKLSRADILLAFWISALILGTWFLIRILRQPKSFTLAFQTAAIFLFAINTIELVYKVILSENIKPAFTQVVHAENADHSNKLIMDRDQPDIYYIILDGHTRADTLEQVFKLDNSAFIDDLRSHGFYVADQSYTNYSQTLLSLTSSLNMQYLDNLISLDTESSERRKLEPLYQKNRVMEYFNQRGYTTYSLSPGVSTLNKKADVYIPRSVQLNEFESASMKSSMSVLFFEAIGKKLYYIDAQNEFANLKKVIVEPGPKFVLAHILSPHPPFVMTEDGEMIQDIPFKYDDGAYCYGSSEEYAYGYSEQLKYAEREIIQILDEILSQPGPKPIIILQGDHGSALLANQMTYEPNCLHERMSILNAYYFPGGQTDDLYPGISPVNSFRVVLNTYFGEQLPLLEDQHYFAAWAEPFKFFKVGQENLDQICQP